MADVLGIIGFIFFSLMLFAAGTALLRAIIVITRFLRLPFFTTSFILLAVGTSIPELFVGIQAGLRQASELTVGVVLGANILDMTLVTGMWLLLVRRIKLKNPHLLNKDCLWMVGISILPLLFIFLFGGISRVMGGVLVAVFLAYSYWLISRQPRSPPEKNHIGRWQIVVSTLLFALSLAALFWASAGVVEYATRLAISFALPPIFIGLFLVSFGTTLPELIVQLRAGRNEGGHIGLGNIVGSVITNSTLVLGVSTLIAPATPHPFLFLTSALFMLFIGLLYALFVKSGTMVAYHGALLILLFVLFLVVELTLKGIIPAGTLT